MKRRVSPLVQIEPLDIGLASLLLHGWGSPLRERGENPLNVYLLTDDDLQRIWREHQPGANGGSSAARGCALGTGSLRWGGQHEMSDEKRWIRDYLRKLDHRIKLEGIREKGRELADLRRRNHRSEEKLTIAVARTCAKLQNRTLADLQRFHEIAVSDVVLPWDRVRGTGVARHAAELLATHRITATYDVLGGVNGYANYVRRTIDTSPINNVSAYTTLVHEVGHVAVGCPPSHKRATVDDTPKRVCVRCELEAWRFATQNARPHWTRAMHDHMRRALMSYRKYGTPAEQEEIDRFVSNLNYCKLRQERAQRG